MARAAAKHLRAAAVFAAMGGRRHTMAPIRFRAVRAMQHIVRALVIVEEWEVGRRALARRRGFRRRAERTMKRLAVEPRRTNP